MIDLLSTILPYLFVMYFLYRTLKEPLFIMGIPFLLFMGPSIFIEKAVLFVIPFRYFYYIARNADLLLVAYLLICWVIFKFRNIAYAEKNLSVIYSDNYLNIFDYLIIFLLIITIFGFGIVLNEYYMFNGVYDKFVTLLALFAGFFIIKDVVFNTKPEVLKDFLFSLVIVTTIASAMYFLHQGLRIPIYAAYKEYQTSIVDGETISRTFWFMPNLLFFSISYLLVLRESKSFINIIMLLINILAVYISYTRTSLIIVVLLIVGYYLLTGFKNKNFAKSVRNLFIVTIASISLFFIVSSFLPASTQYFISRFKDLKESPADRYSNNLVFRFYKTGVVINKMEPVKVLFGYGPVTESQVPFVNFLNRATADMAWAEIVFRWGYTGLILFFLLFIISIIKAFFLFVRTEGILSHLALILLLLIFSQTIESFTQFTIMYPNKFALSLWYFGILSALHLLAKSKDRLQNAEYKLLGDDGNIIKPAGK